MRFTKMATSVVAAALLIVGGTAAANAHTQTTWKTVKVHFTPVPDPATSLGETCDTSGDQCVSASSLTATQTGDLQGSTAANQSIAYSYGTSVFPETQLGTFTGNVKGCGTGGFLYHGFAPVDATTLQYTFTFMIVPGSGTGQLAGITGVFTQTGSLIETTVPPLSGLLRCHAA